MADDAESVDCVEGSPGGAGGSRHARGVVRRSRHAGDGTWRSWHVRGGVRALAGHLAPALLLGTAAVLLSTAISPSAAGARLFQQATWQGRLRSARSWRRPTARAAILGGQVAGAGTFPWLAYILDFKGQVVGQCTGTVIAPNLVLTAGHCGEEAETGTLDPPSGYHVVTGATDWSSETERQVSAVSRVIVYPGFHTRSLAGDAALLVLSNPTSDPAIALAQRGQAGLAAAGAEAVVAGWGQTDPEQSSLTQRLRFAATVIQRRAYCERNAAPFYPGRELCATDPPSFTTGPCKGDSGGPLIVNGASGPVEIGLVSHGPADCATDQPSVYTRVEAISSWAGEWVAAIDPGFSTPAGAGVPAPSTAGTITTPATRPSQGVGPTPPTLPSGAGPHAARPADGRYRGGAGAAHSPIALVIGSHGRRLTAIAARITYRCRAARTVRSSLQALSNGEPERIGGRGRFVLRLAAGGERVTIAGGVGKSAGVLSGTITGVDRGRRGARCATGLIHWRATRSTVAARSGDLARPGSYRGLTEQGAALTVRVAHGGRRLVRLRFTAVYRCPGGRRARLTRTLLSPQRTAALESPGSFTVEMAGGKSRGRVDGTFGLVSGLAFGTLRASVDSPYGRCRTGLVGWQARR